MGGRNVVVVVADTLRLRESLDPAGPPEVMPFLRAMAKDAVVFPRAIASSPWTVPSHASLLMGVDPWRTNQSFILRATVVPSERGLAASCRERGGEAVIFSANPLVSLRTGTAHGHEVENPGLPLRSFLGPYWQSATLLTGSLLEHLEQRRPTTPGQVDPGIWPDPGPLRRLSWAMHRVTGAQLTGHVLAGSLRRYLRGRDRSRPVQLTFNLMEVHEPYLCDDHRGTPESEGTWFPTWNLGYHADHINTRPAIGEGIRRSYRRRAFDLDQVLRRIVEELRAGGALDDAWLLLVSDHGQSLGEHAYYGHGRYLYDELVRVPAALWAFEHGRALPPPLAPDLWMDHRHLFDLMMAGASGAVPKDIGELSRKSVERRGPAVSVYQGTSIHCQEFLRVREMYRSVRVFSESAISARTTEGLGEGSRTVPDLSTEGAESTPAGALASRLILRDAIRDAREARGDAVGERLRSWGYG
jgi:hypothetical protein